VKAIEGVVMHRTIEALYKDGKIIPLGDVIPVREARVLVTFIEEEKGKAPKKYRTKEMKKCIIVAMITLQKGDLLIKHSK
jgi:hypothetical protein